MNKKLLFSALMVLLSLYIQAQSQLQQVEFKKDKNSPRLFFSVEGGLSYLTVSVKDEKKSMVQSGADANDVDKFYSDFKLGYHARATAGLMFSKNLGAGIKYRYFNSNAKMMTFLDPQDGMNLYYGELSENVYLNFVGGSFVANRQLSEHWAIGIDYGVGLTLLHDETVALNYRILTTGATLSLDLGFRAEYKITRRLSTSVQAALYLANFKTVTMDDGYQKETIDLDKDQYLNYSAIDLSAGFVYRF